jgi:hypothetical protein
MSTELTVHNRDDYAIIERVAILGDLSGLQDHERVQYYTALCRSLGLNPLTKPFEYIELDRRLVLYATRGATDQLRDKQGVSLRVTKREANTELGIYSVEVEATLNGRTDFSTGIVSLEKERGEWKTSQAGKRYFAGTGEYDTLRGVDLANAMMKAETKAKRRATLSICGLGMIDESEALDIPRATLKAVEVSTGAATVNVHTGEIVEETAEDRGLYVTSGTVSGITSAYTKNQVLCLSFRLMPQELPCFLANASEAHAQIENGDLVNLTGELKPRKGVTTLHIETIEPNSSSSLWHDRLAVAASFLEPQPA